MPKEGFWRERDNRPITSLPGDELPWPKPHQWKWEANRERIIHRLKRVQVKARGSVQKGVSRCRLCGGVCGATEYTYKGWVWPSGLLHYIEEHNVCPSKKFRKFLKEES
jgi:hypothetical protein